MKLEAYTAVSCEKQALDKTKISHRVADRIKNRCLFRYERVRTCKTTIQFCFFSVFFHPSLWLSVYFPTGTIEKDNKMAQTNLMPMGPWKVSIWRTWLTLHYPQAQGAATGFIACLGTEVFQLLRNFLDGLFVFYRSLCTIRSTSRAGVWSSLPAARTSWSVAWRTSVPWRSSVARTYPEIFSSQTRADLRTKMEQLLFVFWKL